MTPLADILPSFDEPAPPPVAAPVAPEPDHGPRGMGFCIWVCHPDREPMMFELVETREQAEAVLSRKKRLVRLSESQAVFYATAYADQVREQGS